MSAGDADKGSAWSGEVNELGAMHPDDRPRPLPAAPLDDVAAHVRDCGGLDELAALALLNEIAGLRLQAADQERFVDKPLAQIVAILSKRRPDACQHLQAADIVTWLLDERDRVGRLLMNIADGLLQHGRYAVDLVEVRLHVAHDPHLFYFGLSNVLHVLGAGIAEDVRGSWADAKTATVTTGPGPGMPGPQRKAGW